MHCDTPQGTPEAYSLSGQGPPLAERHRHELEQGSAIPSDIVADEVIRTITTRAEAARLGYTESWQQLVPAIAFPVHPPDGSNSLYVLKPDRPRARKDRPDKFVKYEWPSRQPHRLDVPLQCMAQLADPAVDVYVVEGKKKGLALAARGLCASALWGVWAWGKKPSDNARCELLPDWDLIPLDGRRVFIVFDSDRDEKENVDLAARQLAARLAERGAEVYHVILPSELDGSKNGADDLIVRHGFEAFEHCVEEAIDRGPHGTEALRAAWRRQRAEIRGLKERAAATTALLEVPTAQLDPGEKAVLFTTAAEIEKRVADKGSSDYRAFNLTTMAKRAGLSPGSYGRKLDRFCQGEGRLFDKHRAPTNPDDPLDPRRSIYLRVAREGCGTFGGILWTAIRTAETKDDAWGGQREKIVRSVSVSVPVCSENADDPLHVIASCEVHGVVTLDTTVNAPKDRNTQDAFSPPEDNTDQPIPVAIQAQDACSASEEQCTECGRPLYPGAVARGVCDPCARALVVA